MNTITIHSKDFIDESRAVTDSAAAIAQIVADSLQNGASVVVSVRGVRGVSSSFFNIIFAAAARVLNGDAGRFSVITDTPTQELIYRRSWDAFFKPRIN